MAAMWRLGGAVLCGLGLAGPAAATGGHPGHPVVGFPVAPVYHYPVWPTPFACPTVQPALSPLLPVLPTIPQARPTPAPPSAPAAPPAKAKMPPAATTAPTERRAPVISESRFNGRSPAPAAEGDRCRVGFWNLSGRDVTVTIDGTPRPLPKDRAITVDVGRAFRWQVDGQAAQSERVPDAQASHEIVIRSAS